MALSARPSKPPGVRSSALAIDRPALPQLDLMRFSIPNGVLASDLVRARDQAPLLAANQMRGHALLYGRHSAGAPLSDSERACSATAALRRRSGVRISLRSQLLEHVDVRRLLGYLLLQLLVLGLGPI